MFVRERRSADSELQGDQVIDEMSRGDKRLAGRQDDKISGRCSAPRLCRMASVSEDGTQVASNALEKPSVLACGKADGQSLYSERYRCRLKIIRGAVILLTNAEAIFSLSSVWSTSASAGRYNVSSIFSDFRMVTNESTYCARCSEGTELRSERENKELAQIVHPGHVKVGKLVLGTVVKQAVHGNGDSTMCWLCA